jgi:hypothetical protein
MTQPVQEPTQGRMDSGQEWRTRQLFRRPSPAPSLASGLPFAIIYGTGINLLADTDQQQLVGLSNTYTNDASIFDVTGTADAIGVPQTGWYKVDAALDHADSMPGLDGFWAQYGGGVDADDRLLAQNTNLLLGAGTFVRQSFHLFEILEPSLDFKLEVILSLDTDVAAAEMTLAVYKVA